MMLLATLFIHCVGLIIFASAQGNNCGISGKPSGLIVNGTPSNRGQWPWLVAIYKIQGNQFLCGGTLISSETVLTAAHCLQNKQEETPKNPNDLVIKLGRYDLSQTYERDAIDAYASSFTIHPDWKYYTKQYDADIAVIKLSTQVTFNDVIFPICMWNDNKVPDTMSGYIAGWGKSEGSAPHENIPRELDVTILTNEECFLKNPRFPHIASFNTFCAGKDSFSGPCFGDSGGGLFIRHNSRWFLRGIVSSSFINLNKCDVSADALFTNVLKFSTWINEMLTKSTVNLIGRVNPGKEVVCSITGWAIYRDGGGKFTIENFKPELCTIAIYHFAGLSEDGTIKSIDPWADLPDNGGLNGFKRFTSLKQKHPHLRTLLSIGGWNEGSEKYSKLAANRMKSKAFALHSSWFLLQYGFDGLDLSWDYPGVERGGSSSDRENFVHLLKDISDVYRSKNLYLSATLRAVKYIIDDAYDVSKLMNYVDSINIMTFDMAGAWDKKIGFHSPLRSDKGDNIRTSVEVFLAAGVPAHKLFLGIPFYGRTYVTSTGGRIGDVSESEGFSGPFIGGKVLAGYNELCYMKKQTNWLFEFDNDASQMIGKFIGNGKMNVVTFDTPRAVANKVKFAMEKGLGGVWAWSVDTDDFNGDCEPDAHTYDNFIGNKPALPAIGNFQLLRTINDVIKFHTTK